MKIKSVDLGIISNSRNEETIEVTINNKFKASCGGDGILNKTINENPNQGLFFLNKILNKGLYDYDDNDFKDILEIEELLLNYDNSHELKKIGGNVLLSLEFALLKLISNNKPFSVLNKRPDKFPLHLCNCIVTNFKENKHQQEIILIPKTNKFSDGYFANSYVYKNLNKILKTNEKNDEGSFITNLKNEDVLFQLEKLTSEVTKKLGIEFAFGLNLNSKSIFKNGIYKIGDKSFTVNEHISELNKLVNKFDIEYLEDPLSVENIKLMGKLKTDYISGNRVFSNNLQNFKKFARYFNCAIVKINELGSLGRLKRITDFCKNNDINTVLGQTLGDTNETIISDLAVGFEFDFIKYSVFGKERISKLN